MKHKHGSMNMLTAEHKHPHPDYEYDKKAFIRRGETANTLVNIYEIPPLKSAFPYHYHTRNEETFYILSGEGLLKTPDGEERVKSGDLLFFPANSNGAHKLTNTSESEKLIVLDVDVIHDLDVAVYPDSNKIGVWGKGINKVFSLDDEVDYYKGE